MAIGYVSLLGACGDDDDASADGDADVDADGDGDAGWTVEDVDVDDAADQTSLAISASGTIGLVYFARHSYEDGMCPQGDPPGPQLHWELRYAHGQPGALSVEVVDTSFFLGQPHGTTLRYQGETAHIVSVRGDVEPTRPEYCGANDLYLLSGGADGTWSRDLVVADSGETPPSPGCIPATSTFGWVVGWWPALAIDPGGRMAVAWRDVHAGGTLQSKDLFSSDLELAIGGPGDWPKEMIDCGGGAGDYTTLAFQADGALVAAWYTSVADAGRRGIWLSRRSDADDWETAALFENESAPRPSMAVAPDGTIGVVWAQDQALRYASVAPGQPLADAVVEVASPPAVHAGRYASLAFSADSVPLVAHYRCNRHLPGDDTCDPVEDGPVLSWRAPDGWRTEDVAPADDFLCGTDTQAGVLPDGTIVVAFTCQTFDATAQTFSSALRVATRPAL